MMRWHQIIQFDLVADAMFNNYSNQESKGIRAQPIYEVSRKELIIFQVFIPFSGCLHKRNMNVPSLFIIKNLTS